MIKLIFRYASTNPIIYAISNRSIREGYKKFFKLISCKNWTFRILVSDFDSITTTQKREKQISSSSLLKSEGPINKWKNVIEKTLKEHSKDIQLLNFQQKEILFKTDGLQVELRNSLSEIRTIILNNKSNQPKPYQSNGLETIETEYNSAIDI